MQPSDLLNVIKRGASMRRHRFWRSMRVVAIPVLGAIAAQALVYTVMILRADREDWSNLVVVCAVLGMVPVSVSVLLVSLRSQSFPITLAAFVTAVVFNFAVVMLAALRVPVSYVGMLLATFFTLFFMIYANLRLRQANEDRIGILKFKDAEALRNQIGGKATIIESPFETIRGIDRVLIDGETHHSAQWSSFLVRLYMLGIEVIPWIRFLETRLGRVDAASFDIDHLAFSPSQIYYSKAKRAIDIAAVLTLSPVVVPICAVVWVYIWALDGRPVVFRQRRRGYGGGTFTLFKFRTMYRDADHKAAQANDRRILPGCRFLRLWRLDELPQMINILRGEMSWIGPRPISLPIAVECEAILPQYAHRHLVLPGLTGWAQVSHKYASNAQEEIEKLAYDLYYVKELSFDLDLLILAKTLRIILLRIGAR